MPTLLFPQSQEVLPKVSKLSQRGGVSIRSYKPIQFRGQGEREGSYL